MPPTSSASSSESKGIREASEQPEVTPQLCEFAKELQSNTQTYSFPVQEEDKFSPICTKTHEDPDDFCGEEINEEEEEEEKEDKNVARYSKGRRRRYKGSVSRVMEYDLEEMFPDMSLLIRRKRDWDFHDPDLIRAIFVESETSILADWKAIHARIRLSKKPEYVVRNNRSNDLKLQFLRTKMEKERRENKKLERMVKLDRGMPTFPVVQMATNVTTQLRHSYSRNNPSVPGHYVQHFFKYKKPPFRYMRKSKIRHPNNNGRL